MFPELVDSRWAEIDLNKQAIIWSKSQDQYSFAPGSNPLIDPEVCSKMVGDLHQSLGVDASFGGYLENRSFLWRYHYMQDTGRFYHLGVDCNVPANTAVAITYEGTVLRVDDDHDPSGGWGPRVIIQPELNPDIVVIYGHLGDVLVSERQAVPEGSVLARVGSPPDNGNWYPHLHVQLVKREIYESFLLEGIEKLDGYAAVEELGRGVNEYPNPGAILNLPPLSSK
jgi:murein DD-endopeptidase MepM/ murein hydrolase activator NlpD